MFSFQFPNSQMPYINEIIKQGAEREIGNEEFLIKEIRDFMESPKRLDMVKGVNYYKGIHDILIREKTIIGESGVLEVVENLPNNKIINNQYKKMVLQKANYLCGKPISLNSENKELVAEIYSILGEGFNSLLKNICIDCLNCGVGYIFINYNQKGEIELKRFKPWEIMPIWEDEERTLLSGIVRMFDVIMYEGRTRKKVTKVEVFEKEGIRKFVLESGRLIPDGIDWEQAYFYKGKKGFVWGELPIVAFKYNNDEIPLINNIKTLQDGLNLMISNFQNNMEEDIRHSILVLKNYDGENLGEFRKNLSTYGVVKVSDEGGVEVLSVDVNSENYKVIIGILKKAIIENAMGFDAKDDRIGSNANQLNIKSMYSDIDLDANGMELEFKVSIEKVIDFIKLHLIQCGKGNFLKEKVDIIFNRDMLINEGEVIENCIKSCSILSEETIISKHPWVTNTKREMDKIREERKSENQDIYEGNF